MKLSVKQYAEILDKAVDVAHGDEAKREVIKGFVKLLNEDAKISKLPDILTHYKTLWNKRHEVIDVTVEASDKEGAKFPTHFGGKKVSLTVKENKELIGGSIFKIGDYLIDGSVRSKINALRN